MVKHRCDHLVCVAVGTVMWIAIVVLAFVLLLQTRQLDQHRSDNQDPSRLREKSKGFLLWRAPRRTTCPESNDTATTIKPLSTYTCLKYHDVESGDVAYSGSVTFKSIFVECESSGKIIVYPENDSCTRRLFEIPYIVHTLCFSYKDADYKIECKPLSRVKIVRDGSSRHDNSPPAEESQRIEW